MSSAVSVLRATLMRDVLNRPIKRGDRLLDQWGNVFTVKAIAPQGLHLQDAKTGKPYYAEKPKMLQVKLADIQRATQQERRALYFKRVYYENPGLRRLKSGT